MKKKKLIIIIISIIVLIVLAFLFSIIFSLINMGNSTIFSNITINNIDVSGKTSNEAIALLNELTQSKINTKINITYQTEATSTKESSDTADINTSIDLTNLDLNYDISTAVDKAYSIGKSGNIFQNNFAILKTFFSKQNININFTYDNDSLKKLANNSVLNLPGKLISNSYYIEKDTLIITKGTPGLILDESEFIKLFENNLYNLSSNESIIIIPTQTKDPEEIDIDSIHSEIYKAPVDAYYEKEPFKVYSEIKGVDFDVNEAKKLIESNPENKEYSIKLNYTQPKVTITDLDINVFPDLLASFSTRYDASNKPRTTNLQLAAKKINGTILSPNEEFSYNKVVGERTIAAGYKEAKMYSNGEVVDGLGGGICQISSTLYNAVVFANLKVTERSNHQFITSYVKAGRDATVVYGSIDFKFKNSRTYPIKISMSVNNGIAKVDIYGIKEKTEYDISFDVDTISTLKYTVKYQEDSSLTPGTEKVKQSGANGCIVNVYKVIKQNGVTISRTLISKDKYNAMTRIILKNSKGSSTTNSSSNSNTNSSNPTVETDTSSQNTQTNTSTENTTVVNSEPTSPTNTESEILNESIT